MRKWWLDRTVRTKGMILIAIPLIALIAISLASLVLQREERAERQAGLVATQLSGSASLVLTDMLNAETGVRGYAATGLPVFLKPYDVALNRLPVNLAALRAASGAQFRSLERALESTSARVMAELAQIRNAVSAGAPVPALRQAMRAENDSMTLFRRQATMLEHSLDSDVAAHRARVTRMASMINALTVSGVALGIAAGVLGVALASSGFVQRIAAVARNAERLGAAQALEPMPAAADELGRLADSLLRAEKLLASRTSELVTARDEALTATRAKNAFLSSTSHELRTPLNAILGFAQLLQLSDLGEEDTDSVEHILVAGRHLVTLIDELIDIARIESGEFGLSVEPVTVLTLVEQICALMAPLAAERTIALHRHCPAPLLTVHADRQRLRQVLINLVSNAIKYNRPGGTVTITCQPDDPGRTSLMVADTGPGIEAADLERIFIPFERLGAERRGVEGTGIGLPLARVLVEAMDGQLTASSVPGEGSAFTVTLPRAPDAVPADDNADLAPGKPAVSDQSGTIIRVLYIEDNPANLQVVARFACSRRGVDLQSATSGLDGIELARTHRPHLIVLDLHLPDIDGEDVLGRLRADPATAGIPVVVLSADAAPPVVQRLRASGIAAFLTKPLDLSELGRLLDSFAPGERATLTPRSTGTPGSTGK